MKHKVRRFELGGPTSYADSGSAGGSKISFKDAFKAARKQGLDTFTWQGKKYTTEMKDKEDKTGAKTESRKMSSEEFVKEYEKSAPSGRMRQEAYYRANPEPSAEAVSPEEAVLGPKAKAAAAGAGVAPTAGGAAAERLATAPGLETPTVTPRPQFETVKVGTRSAAVERYGDPGSGPLERGGQQP